MNEASTGRGEHDYSSDFSRIRRSLTHPSGTTMAAFSRSLTPRYWWVWLSLFAALCGLAACIILLVILDPTGLAIVVPALAGAITIGFLLHFIALYIHEAAHFNLAKSKRANDIIANSFIGPLSLIDIRDYRAVHLDHHRNLATESDPERSYEHPLTFGFVVRGLTGVLAFRVAKRRAQQRDDDAPKPHLAVPLAGLAIHGAIAGLALLTGHYALMFAWGFATFSVFPFLGALRPVLEHRDPALGDAFGTVAYTRNFRPNVLNRLFGGAGFHHHLLHHWEPSVSCTNLRELHEFLSDSSVGSLVTARTTTYTKTIRELIASSREPRTIAMQSGSAQPQT